MNETRPDRLSKSFMLFSLIVSGEVIFFLPFVLPRIFKPTILEVFDISNTELGFFFSIYGFLALGSYLFGGPIADRYSPRVLMSLALLLTALGGVLLATIPPSGVIFWLYGFWGITTILLFWATLMRTTRLLGGESSQGQVFGVLDGGRGLVSALVAAGAIWILSLFLPERAEEYSFEEKRHALQNVIWFFNAFVFGTAVLVFYVLRKIGNGVKAHTKRISLKELVLVSKRPEVWLQSLIILCAYSGYRVTDDFSLLASDMFGYDDVDAARVGSLALWIRPVVAVIAGLTADKFKASTVTLVCFVFMFFGGGLMAFSPEEYYSVFLLTMVVSSTCIGVYALRGLYFAIMGEARIPVAITGTVVGLASVVGYLPDIYMAPLMGVFLDRYEGLVTGHQYVFLMSAGFAILGVLATLMFKKVVRMKEMEVL